MVSALQDVSIPLYAALQRATVLREPTEFLQTLQDLELTEHIQGVIIVSASDLTLDLDSVTDYGRVVLRELKEVSEFPPCPEGSCEFKDEVCIWCGLMRN